MVVILRDQAETGMRLSLICIFGFLFLLQGYAQREVTVFENLQEASSLNYTDSLDLQSQIRDHLRSHWQNGHFFAGIDSTYKDEIYLHLGPKLKIQDNKNFSELASEGLFQLEERTNNGYPFARLTWRPTILMDDRLDLDFDIIEGPFIAYDSIILLKPIRTKRSYIEKVLEITSGNPFSEKGFQRLEKRLQRVNFLKSLSKPDVAFLANKSWIYLELDEKPTGSFQGVLGVLPNQAAGGRPIVTGSIDLELENMFRSGKELKVFWNRFDEESQETKIDYSHPYMGGSSVGLTTKLEILRQDSSFINVQYGLGLNWFIHDALKLGVSYESEEAIVQLKSAQNIETLGINSFKQDWYGLKLGTDANRLIELENSLDYEIHFELGSRSIDEAFGGDTRTQTNSRIQTQIGFQKKLIKSTAFFSRTRFSTLNSKQGLVNQYFRNGGLKTLRGFNENEFFSSTFLIQQIEWRLFFEEQSYLYGFLDQGFIKSDHWDKPTGFGLGLNLDTNSGLFSFAIAVGRSKLIPFETSNAKVHFGYLSRF